MTTRFLSVLTAVIFILACSAYSQTEHRDKGVFVQPKNEFFDKIKKDLREYYKKEQEKKKPVFKMDLSGIKLPTSTDQFTKAWFNPPISQGETGTCWDFAATSFFESEIYRQTKREIKLSEMYTDYWEYVEKARRFVREHGDSFFGEGAELNAVPIIWKKYGIVPESAYTGLKPGQPFHDHRKMFKEMKDYLQNVKATNAWNEEEVLGSIKGILNYYLGEPPTEVTVDGKTYTPKEYFEKVVRLNMDDYVDIMSLMEKPYWQHAEYEVPDNWWKSSTYINVPLDDFIGVVQNAIHKGYTVGIGGDVSEAGYESHSEVAMVPTFDIPSAYINEDARQFRFSNHSTTDDHAIHLVGYTKIGDRNWYLIKDSGSGSRNGKNPGYYFYDQDYLKLKIMTLIVHKDVAKDVLSKLNK